MSIWHIADQHGQQIEKLVTDTSVAVVAISSTEWLDRIDYGMEKFMLYGGVFLLILRIAVGVREWWRGRR